MRIVFICGSLEPGKNGVGDYTRRLACELIRQGIEASIIAIKDNTIQQVVKDTQKDETTSINVMRIPYGYQNKDRLDCAKKWIHAENPDWISLQFVPFSYQKKGLPFGMAQYLKKLGNGINWHIMFHELWVGINKNASIKYKAWGKLQQIIIKSLCNRLNPGRVHTQTKLYQNYLSKLGVKAGYLPLFSNIPIDNNLQFTQKIDTAINLVLFGSIHPDVPLKRFAEELSVFQETRQNNIRVHLIGRGGKETDHWKKELSNHNIECKVWGEQSIDVISRILSQSDFGISTTPVPQIEKSGTVAAMLSHRLSVLLVSPDWQVDESLYQLPANVYDYKKVDFRSFINSSKSTGTNHQLSMVAKKMIEDLQ